MSKGFTSKRSFCILSGLSGILGVVLLIVSFGIAIPPPENATRAELLEFGRQHYAGVLWGAWLQAVGPVLIVLFAFALVHLARATQRLAGWMTLFGATILMTVSLFEITYYVSALFPDPEVMTSISLRVISAVPDPTNSLWLSGPKLVLPSWVTVLAGVQALWWLAAAITLVIRSASLSALEIRLQG